jgi:hypothetical protein
MARHQFTVGEVERLIPSLERIFTRVFQLRIALRGEEQKLDRAGVSISRETIERDNPRDPRPVRHAKAMFRAYCETLAEQLGAVEALGGEVKDLDLGLVDFPSRRSGEDICLCWRFGERSIDFWHAADTGFGSRRPIDAHVPRELPPLD